MRVGSGDFIYEFIPDWGKPPAGYEFGGVPGGAVDGWGRVHVFTRTPHPVLIFDADGTFLKSWGRVFLPGRITPSSGPTSRSGASTTSITPSANAPTTARS